MIKLIKNKKIIAAFAVVLCLSVSCGAAMAYFSDYEEAAGAAVVQLGGETQLEEGNDHANKNIVISNTGDTNMIVRLQISGSPKYMTISHEHGDASAWEKIGDFYYYKKVLLPGETTPQIDANLKAEWKDKEPGFDDYDFEILVVHEAAQAVYNGQTLVTPQGWADISNVIDAAPIKGVD